MESNSRINNTMTNTTLTSVFDCSKEQLKNQLDGLTIPADNLKIQKIVSSYISSILDSDGDYRQSLTQPEDYILQAAFELLEAQVCLGSRTIIPDNQSIHSEDSTNVMTAISMKQSAYLLAGTAIGGCGGAVCFSTWGGVFGSIAGMALSMYALLHLSRNSSENNKNEKQINSNTPLDVSLFLEDINTLCSKIDSLIETFRVQQSRIRESVSRMNESSQISSMGPLLNRIEGILNAFESDEEDKMTELTVQMNLLKRSLTNYGMEYKDGKIIKK